MTPRERFLKACRREPVDRPPVWMMRQAGRYLPEYRAIRKARKTLQMMTEPETACEITLQPVRRLGVDAAILYSDILMVPRAMGLDLEFVEGTGPVFENPVRSKPDVERLQEKNVPDRCPFVYQTLKLIRKDVGQDFAVLGFAGAPFTVATYMAGGDGSQEGVPLRKWAASDPASYRLLMEKLSRATIEYLAEQASSGADAVQLFDTWAGSLSREDYATLAFPYTQEILKALKARNIPTILYIKGGSHLFPEMMKAGPDVISIDWRLPIAEAKKQAGGRFAIQGNFDPVNLYADPEEITAGVHRMIQSWGQGPGYIINLGHGILPDIPVENAQAFIDAAKNYGQETV